MELWWWMLSIVAVFSVLVILIDRRRGSTGASRADDLPGGSRDRPENTWLSSSGSGDAGGM